MTHQDSGEPIVLRIELPRWFRMVMAFVCVAAALLLGLVAVVFTRSGSVLIAVLVDLFCVGLIALGVYAVRYLYSTYIVTTTAFERHGLMGGYQRIRWADVDRFWTPRLFRGLRCIGTTHGEKIIVPKGLPGYTDLLEVLASKVPGLGTAADQDEQFLAWSWWTLITVIASALLAYYLFLRHR